MRTVTRHTSSDGLRDIPGCFTRDGRGGNGRQCRASLGCADPPERPRRESPQQEGPACLRDRGRGRGRPGTAAPGRPASRDRDRRPRGPDRRGRFDPAKLSRQTPTLARRALPDLHLGHSGIGRGKDRRLDTNALRWCAGAPATSDSPVASRSPGPRAAGAWHRLWSR
jgi:hypothetical protein